MSFESLLIHTCYSGVRSGTRNSLGEYEYTWVYGSNPISCRLFTLSNADITKLPGEFADVRYKIGFVSGSHITNDMRLKIGSSYYQVRSSKLDSSSHHRTVLATEVPV